MALPKILERLFELGGFGQYLNKDIIPNHEDIHRFDGRDPVQIDAGQIITGIISPYRLPDSVKERAVRVKDEAAMLALTIDQVQNGDSVLVSDTGVWYKVVDDTRLDRKSGYLKFGTINISDTGEIGNANTANKLASPIRLVLTGVNGVSDPWDGSSNLTVNVTSIDPELIKLSTPVIYAASNLNIDIEYANKIICCSRKITLNVDTEDLFNGWFFYVKNTSDEFSCTVKDSVNGKLFDGIAEYSVPPLITVKFIFDGSNFITISNIPVVTDGKNIK